MYYIHLSFQVVLVVQVRQNIVYNSFVKNGGWNECVPDNYEWIRKEREEIYNTTMPEPHPRIDDWQDMPNKWIEQYKIWDNKWKV